MLLAAGELTNRSPFGAYTIIRGDCSSANTVIVKPSGTLGIAPSGRGTPRLGFGDAIAGEGSRSAWGCGCVPLNWAKTAVETATAATAAKYNTRVMLASSQARAADRQVRAKVQEYTANADDQA
jgi:hypothetical protein